VLDLWNSANHASQPEVRYRGVLQTDPVYVGKAIREVYEPNASDPVLIMDVTLPKLKHRVSVPRLVRERGEPMNDDIKVSIKFTPSGSEVDLHHGGSQHF